MASNERIRKYLDAGTVLGQVSRGRAEEIVRELVNAGDIQRNQAQEWVDNLVERSRKTSEQVLELVRHEVATQLGKIDGKSLEAIANQVADILKKSAEAGRSATKDVTTQAGKAAKGVTTQAGKTAKGVTTQAGKTAKGVSDAGRQDRHAGAGSCHQGGADPTSHAHDRRSEGICEGFGCPQGADQEGPRQEGHLDRQVGQEGRQLSTGSRRRLDTELVRRGLFPSRHEAQAAIAAGSILVSGAPADKPARLVAPDEPVVVLAPPSPFVGRGGLKLEAALSRFAVPVSGRRALDAGASTGGFTDCLLQRGASRVYAVDVGHGQLHPAVRADPRVTVLERTNARTLTPADLRSADPDFEPCSLVVTDLSFISLRSVVPALVGPVSAPGADLVLLVKPQFEAGRAAVSRGKGVVRDPAVWLGALEGVVSALHQAGTGIMGAMASPLTGAAGNVEFLLHARKGAPGSDADEAAALLSAAVSEAEGHLTTADPAG